MAWAMGKECREGSERRRYLPCGKQGKLLYGWAMGKRLGLVCLVVVCGCAARPGPDLTAEHDAKCRSYGSLPGSDSYVNCRVEMAKTAEQREMEKRRAMAAAVNDGFSDLGNSMKPKPSTTCTSRKVFDTVQTVCK